MDQRIRIEGATSIGSPFASLQALLRPLPRSIPKPLWVTAAEMLGAVALPPAGTREHEEFIQRAEEADRVRLAEFKRLSAASFDGGPGERAALEEWERLNRDFFEDRPLRLHEFGHGEWRVLWKGRRFRR